MHATLHMSMERAERADKRTREKDARQALDAGRSKNSAGHSKKWKKSRGRAKKSQGGRVSYLVMPWSGVNCIAFHVIFGSFAQ